ncbi:MAG: glycosyltransferase family 4 protein, partial [Bacteroidia bacterium]
GMEAKKLERFERVLNKASYIAAISPADAKSLSERYKNVYHITAFHPNEEVKISEGKGAFCLYHGNLEVGENNEAALYLVNQVFSKTRIPLIIAGRKPSAELAEAVSGYEHIKLKANINTQDIDELIRTAQINVLPTFQSTGIKLKLLAALFTGRHCVVNSPMVANTGLEDLCSVKDSADEMTKEIIRLFELPFDMTEKEKREKILMENFSNVTNVKKLVGLI